GGDRPRSARFRRARGLRRGEPDLGRRELRLAERDRQRHGRRALPAADPTLRHADRAVRSHVSAPPRNGLDRPVRARRVARHRAAAAPDKGRPRGVRGRDASQSLRAPADRAGGARVTVAVLDTGVAYANRKGYRRSPDFRADQFARGYDFVDHDPYPLDTNGHGTHVASTIAEGTNNGYGLTGLAYGARIMPVR